MSARWTHLLYTRPFRREKSLILAVHPPGSRLGDSQRLPHDAPATAHTPAAAVVATATAAKAAAGERTPGTAWPAKCWKEPSTTCTAMVLWHPVCKLCPCLHGRSSACLQACAAPLAAWCAAGTAARHKPANWATTRRRIGVRAFTPGSTSFQGIECALMAPVRLASLVLGQWTMVTRAPRVPSQATRSRSPRRDGSPVASSTCRNARFPVPTPFSFLRDPPRGEVSP